MPLLRISIPMLRFLLFIRKTLKLYINIKNVALDTLGKKSLKHYLKIVFFEKIVIINYY